MTNFTRNIYSWLTAFLLLLTTVSYAQKSIKRTASEAKITIDLLAVQQQSMTTSSNLPPELQGTEREAQFMRKNNTIAIEAVVVDGQDGSTLLAQLQALGLTDGLVEKQMVTGYLPVDKINELKELSALRFARPAYKPMHNVGLVTSQADRAMKADLAKQLYNVTGSGSKIGVLSDSYNSLGGAPAGVASGDLPANVQVIDDFIDPDASDEGRGMIELIHDLAPGAALAFNTAFKGQVAFAKGIRDLAAAACNIIVDDVFYFAEPYFQDGIIAQAVDDVKNTRNVTYFSSAGNHARNSYQNTYANTPFVGPFGASDPYVGAHNFGGGDVFQSVTVPARSSIYVGLQWDNPFASVSGGAGAQTDMDLLVYRGGVFQGSLSSYNNNIGGDPVEIAVLSNTSSTTVTFELVVARYSGPAPSVIKWVAFTNGYTITTEYATRSSTCVGHPNAAGAIATGAAYYRNTPVYNNTLTTAIIEGFSSLGGTPILFNTAGQRIQSVTRQKPEITAADGANTTFFGSDSDGDGFPNFFGTSAAAPHAAAVAALMQQRSGNRLSPNQVMTILEQTALDMDDELTAGFDTGYDPRTGYGFVQADRAVMMSNTAPTVANAIPPQSATVGQAYTYVIPSTTFTDAETPGSLALSVSGLPPGLSFMAPATISGTPTTAAGSPFSVTVVATDPGSLTVGTMFTFTIIPGAPTATAPVAPSIPNQMATVGTAFMYIVPAFSGTSPITYSASGLPAGLSFDAGSRMISGTPTMAQVSSVTVTGTNSAGSGSGIFTITVSASAVGGNFDITGVNTVNCEVLSPGLRRLTFMPIYSGLSGQPVTFQVVNETLPTMAAGPYSVSLYTDNPTVTLRATQAGTAGTATYSYNWLSACSSPTNTPPVAPTIPNQTATVGSFFSYVIPAFSGTMPITYSASGLPAGLNFDAVNHLINGTPTMGQTALVTITGTNAAGSTSATFTITVNGSTPVGNFAITSVNTISCQTLSPGLRRVTFTPTYSGLSGQPVTFQVRNETLPTMAAGPYSVSLYTDNPTVTLQAMQAGTSDMATYTYNWLAACTSNARPALEVSEKLSVAVLGNPALNELVSIELRGANEQPVVVRSVDSQGRSIQTVTVDRAGTVERVDIRIGRSPGMYMLHVSTPGQQEAVKLIKQ
ncbi:putative Ig domain-containing protein [Spirosoma sp. KUDC1026]|uniref:putative Ig domain-containing protein n=1 Tax=Spirosoma sp. KUDC1026 TaxID=2745947 RepID=UPI00159BD251|nr:putative Ig domain-containing protein [Spirosoma sp. KUDC1026]QKZ11139.1 putative Ig domain-containing protein [Spirosoma sp. KUDC1026]